MTALLSRANLQALKSHVPARDELARMSVDEKLDYLRLFAGAIGVFFELAAFLWSDLESQDVDLRALIDEDPYIFGRIRDIASGKLSMGVVRKFAASEAFDKVRKMPPARQEKLAADDRVPVATKLDSGEITERMVPLSALGREQVRMVVDDEGNIRTFNQQVAYLTPPPVQVPAKETKVFRARFLRGKVVTPPGGSPPEEVIRLLRQNGHLPVES